MDGRLAAALVVILALTSCATQVTRQELAGEYHNIGNAYFGLEEFEKAAEYYARAADLDPELLAASYNLARAYIQEERYDEALRLVGELLAEDPENTRLLQTRAYASYLAGDTEGALEVYRAVLAIDPFNADVMYNIAVIYQGERDWSEAYRWVQASLEINEDSEQAILLAGRLAYELERFEDAVDRLGSYLEKSRNDVEARRLLADAYRKDGFYNLALTQYDRVLDAEPRDGDALYGKSVALLIGAQDVDTGLAALRSAISAGFDEGELAEAELLVEANVALSETRQILVERGLLEVEEDSDESDGPSSSSQ